MKPDFRIEIGGIDRTDMVRTRLLDAKVTDEAGQMSDRLELNFDDRDAAIPIPPKDADIRLWLGYADHPTLRPVYMGSFKVDEAEVGSGPRSLAIRAKAADLGGGFRSPKFRSWDGKTIGDIVGQVAADNGYTPLIDPELSAIVVPHIDQTEESDAAFLTRLAGNHDAVAKPADGKLIFTKRHGDTRPGGGAIPTVALTPKDFTSWKAKISERGNHGKVTSYYQDHATGERAAVTVGDGGDDVSPYLDRDPYGTREEAEAGARAKLNDFGRGKLSFNGSGPGRPDLFAEARIVLSGFRPGVDGSYALKSVEHSFSNSGFTTSVTAETTA